jgi:hypothetical protein
MLAADRIAFDKPRGRASLGSPPGSRCAAGQLGEFLLAILPFGVRRGQAIEQCRERGARVGDDLYGKPPKRKRLAGFWRHSEPTPKSSATEIVKDLFVSAEQSRGV